MIDFVITNRILHPSQILDVRTLTSAHAVTQHSLVLCKVRVLLCKLNGKKKPNYITKFNVESLKDESIKILYQRRLDGKITQNPVAEIESVEELWRKVKTNITNSANEAIRQRTINTNGSKNNKPWFTQEVKTAAKERREAYIRYTSNRTPKEYGIYKEVRNRVNNEIKRLKQTYWERFSTEIEHDTYGGQKKV